MSRHRGAKPPRRYELLGEISLLSPEYLLSDERRPFHSESAGSLRTYFRTCSSYFSCSQAHLYPYARCVIADHAECTIALLRYFLGGDRPSQTTHLTLSATQIHGIALGTYHDREWYFTVDSTRPESPDSTSPTYATHDMTSLNIRL